MPRFHESLVQCLMTSLFVLASSFAIAVEQDVDAEAQVKLTKYIEVLSALDPGNLDSIQEGLQHFEVRFDGASVDNRDAAFLVFRRFFYNVEQEQIGNERLDEIEIEMAFVETLARNGFRLVEAEIEGYWYVDERPDFLYGEFGEQVSEPIRELLKIRVRELEEGFSDDAALVISYENVAGRVQAWDRYLVKYPDSPLLDEAKYFYRAYFHTFLVGANNTPVFDYVLNDEDKVPRVYPHIREIYREYARNHQGTQSGKTVKEYLSILEKSDFRRSEEVDAFLQVLWESLRSVQKPDSW